MYVIAGAWTAGYIAEKFRPCYLTWLAAGALIKCFAAGLIVQRLAVLFPDSFTWKR
ncbi:MAG: hypothetical protein IJR85_02725 [Synergistaceae bacterium]|nr:hypothetical protein [Synergistaceae bacterium]